MDLSKILKDEAWLEAEKRGEPVELCDEHIFQRALRIWNEEYSKQPIRWEYSSEKDDSL
jgi:hypothetical protein